MHEVICCFVGMVLLTCVRVSARLSKGMCRPYCYGSTYLPLLSHLAAAKLGMKHTSQVALILAYKQHSMHHLVPMPVQSSVVMLPCMQLHVKICAIAASSEDMCHVHKLIACFDLLQFATEAAITILRIDDMIRIAPGQDEEMG